MCAALLAGLHERSDDAHDQTLCKDEVVYPYNRATITLLHCVPFAILQLRSMYNFIIIITNLGSENSLEHFREVILGDVAQGLSHTGKGGLLVVGAAHASTNHDVVALEGLAVLVHDDDKTEIVDEDVDGVVTRHSDSHLELARQVLAAAHEDHTHFLG
jgi:hypothetical protein